MAKSRMAIALFVALAAASAEAQDASAPDAWVEAQRRALRVGSGLDCPPASDPEEIVVCGRDHDEEQARHRLPLAVTRPPRPSDRAGGEQAAALGADSSRCTTVGRDQSCGGVDFLGMGLAIARAIATKILEDD